MVQVWITLSDLQPRFQGRDIIQRQITQKTVQDRAIYNGGQIASRINELSNGAIFNELERPLLPVSRSRHSLALNISETVRHTDTVTLKYLHTPYATVPFRMILSDLEWLSKIFNDTNRRADSATAELLVFFHSYPFNETFIVNGKSHFCSDTFTDVRFTSLLAKNA